jgi:predicted nucleic acid-binding protein
MNVKEAIELLSKMPDKELVIMLDCPYCGKANELITVDEVAVLRSEKPPE